jgi:ABC-2 type transport system ATP-binding protein
MIQIKQLQFSYGSNKVFENLDLEFKPGHIYGLLGKNGTGKSTLLRCLSGVLFPDSGTIRVLDREPGKRHPSFLQSVFLVAEEFYLPDVSIDEYIKSNAPFYPRFDKKQLDHILKEFEIPTDRLLTKMSYGQKKKFLISFGLACNTEVLLMDEPTNGLDIMSKSQFRKVMAGVVDENKCVIISTHQVKDLESLIDRVTIIDEGSILFDHTIDNIARTLSFQITSDPHKAEHSLYRENSLNGMIIVDTNPDEDEQRVDLELLYKAIILNGENVRNAFKKKINTES